MKILIAPDSFKGSLSAKEVCDIISRSISDIDGVETVSLPLSDGGEGFGNCCCDCCKGDIIYDRFSDIYGNTISAPVYFCKDIAVIECASACFLQEKRNVMDASSFGTGQQISFAYEKGYRKFIIGLGGSGMCDGGTGALAALGASFYDNNNKVIPFPTGKDMSSISKIEYSEKIKKIAEECSFTYACDVENPYYGVNGAAYVFAPQKGADEKQVEELDKGLRNIARLFNRDISAIPGSGAAGGLCGGLLAVLGGKTESGFDIIANLADLEEQIKNSDIVVTGEGKTDYQTLFGKLPFKVASLAKKHNKRCILISGDSDNTIIGDKQITLTDENTTAEQAIKNCRKLLYAKAKYILQ